jgi:hypothetical protein
MIDPHIIIVKAYRPDNCWQQTSKDVGKSNRHEWEGYPPQTWIADTIDFAGYKRHSQSF